MLNQVTKLLFSSNPSTFDAQTTVYNFNKGKNISVTGNKENASILLKYYFASISCLISKPLFTISPSKVIIHLCYYNPKDVSFAQPHASKATAILSTEGSASAAQTSLVPNFKTIGYMLNQIFNKPVELELIPLRYPYHDSTILAQVIALNSKKYNFNRMMQKLFQKATIITQTYSSSSPSAWLPALSEEQSAAESLNNASCASSKARGGAAPASVEKSDASSSVASSTPSKLISPISQLTGIKVTIAGRLITQRIVPKSTVKTAYKGQLSSALGGKMSHKFIDSATYTSKNKIGAYTVRVQLGHKVSN
jgi:hypothetical protein